jgi:hypothetical protein
LLRLHFLQGKTQAKMFSSNTTCRGPDGKLYNVKVVMEPIVEQTSFQVNLGGKRQRTNGTTDADYEHVVDIDDNNDADDNSDKEPSAEEKKDYHRLNGRPHPWSVKNGRRVGLERKKQGVVKQHRQKQKRNKKPVVQDQEQDEQGPSRE